MKKALPRLRKAKTPRTHKNMAAAALANAAFRPRRIEDETKTIPRKRKHKDDNNS